MKNYKYKRDLDGSPEGTVRSLDPSEVAALINSGAIEETDEEPTPVAATEAEPIDPITIEGARGAGKAPAKAKAAKSADKAN